MRKKVLLIVLFALALTLLAGCGRGGDDNGNGNGNGGEGNGQVAEIGDAEPVDLGLLGPHNPQTWTMMVVTSNTPPTDDNWLVEKIREELGVTLILDLVPSDMQEMRIATLLAGGGDLPDIIHTTLLDAPMTEAGALMRLDDLLFSGQFPRLAYHHAPYRGRLTYRGPGVPQGIYQLSTYNRLYTDAQGGGPIIDPMHGTTAFWLQKSVLEFHGFPDLSNMTLERYFDMIEAYMQANPTIDGMPTIGFTSPMLGRVWGLTNPPQFLAGHPNNGEVLVENGVARIFHNTEYAEYYWRTLNDAFHRGLVDPETWTRTEDEYFAALAQGRVLGFHDQGWAINTPRDALIERGLYSRTWVPLEPVKDPATIRPWYTERPVLNVNQGIGIPSTATEEEAILRLLFIETLLSPEWQILFNWGREGIDFHVDENGMFYRTQEQRDEQLQAAWAQANRFAAFYTALPKIMGSLPCGNAWSPGWQPSEFQQGLRPYFLDFLESYGKGTWSAFVTPPPSNPPYYPAWQAPIPGGSPASEAAAQIEDIRATMVPGLISAPPGEFDARWEAYLAAIDMVNVAALEAQIQEFIDARIAAAAH